MYKYFKELDNPQKFVTYLVDTFKEDYYVNNVTLNIEFFNKYKKLFDRLKIVDIFIKSIRKELVLKNISYRLANYNKVIEILEFFEQKNNHYLEIDEINKKIDIKLDDLKYLLNQYVDFIPFLIDMYPKYTMFFKEVQKMIYAMLSELHNRFKIEVNKNKGIKFYWPNSWYITPNGFLYNTGDGHKQGNLRYSFFNIFNSFYNESKISYKDNRNHIREIINRGYITDSEFKNYANLIYNLPTISSENRDYPEFILNQDKVSNLSKTNQYRSYQKNLITLIIGYLSAEEYFYKAFYKLNDSKQKKKSLDKIIRYANKDFTDILVRFVGFSKIESCERKITTSSPYAASEFKMYLDRGFKIYIVPRIIYDKEKDDIYEMDFSSYYLDEHFNKVLKENNGNKKILIRGKNI